MKSTLLDRIFKCAPSVELTHIVAFSSLEIDLGKYKKAKKLKKGKKVSFKKFSVGQNRVGELALMDSIKEYIKSSKIENALDIIRRDESGSFFVFDDSDAFEKWLQAQRSILESQNLADQLDVWIDSGIGFFYMYIDY